MNEMFKFEILFFWPNLDELYLTKVVNALEKLCLFFNVRLYTTGGFSYYLTHTPYSTVPTRPNLTEDRLNIDPGPAFGVYSGSALELTLSKPKVNAERTQRVNTN